MKTGTFQTIQSLLDIMKRNLLDEIFFVTSISHGISKIPETFIDSYNLPLKEL